MYWLPYSSHTSHHPSQTPYPLWISYAAQNWCSINARWSKSSLKHSHTFLWHHFPSLKHNFIAYHSSSRPDCILKFTSCDNQALVGCIPIRAVEIIKIGQSSHKMYSNNIVNFQESTIILNACTRRVWKLIEGTTYVSSKMVITYV